jgi:hypothetical protein
MAANTVTYFGDVTTVGNTVVFQNLTSQGNYSIFSGNVNPAVTATTSVTTGGVLFTSNSNTTTLNVTSFYGTTGNFIGLSTTGGGASLNTAGNAWTSNALSGPNVFATTSANVATLNTAAIFGILGFTGIGGIASGATINVSGNTWASNALSAPNVFATTSANLASLNTAAIFGTANLVGINTTASGATLNIAGNVWSSNALAAQNVFASTSANTTNLITTTIVSTTGFVGINTTGGGAVLNVAGNSWASNALSAPNVFATTSANLASLNTSAIFGTSGLVGINTTGSGATLNVAGNAWASNALSAPIILASTSANLTTLNTSAIFGTSGLVGINTTGSGATLNVAGNAWASNALSAPIILATTSANLTTLNTSAIFGTSGLVGINTTGSGATLNIAGNAWASNALSAPNVFATTSANTANLITTRIVSTTGFIGVNCAGGGATLNVLGNVWISNTLSTPNIAPTMNANIVTTNVTYMNLVTAGLGINGPAQAGTANSTTGPFTTIPDGTVNTGTLFGAVVVGNAPTSNTALSIPGSTSWLALGTSSPMNVDLSTFDMFVEAWVYLPVGYTGTAELASVANAGTSGGWRLNINTTSMSFDNNRQNKTTTIAISTGVWHHIAAGSSQNAKQIVQYLDGANRNLNTWGAGGPTYSATQPAYIGAFNGTGGGTGYYIRDVRVSYGTLAGSGVSFTPESAPFGSTVPSYAITSGGTVAYRLYQTYNYFGVGPLPLVKVAGNVWCSNAFQTPSARFTNVLAVTSNLGPTATKRIFSPAAGGIVGVGQVPSVGGATLQVTGNIFASNALQAPLMGFTAANSVFSNVTSNLFTNSNQLLGINKVSPSSNLDVSGNVLVTGGITVTGINEQLPVVAFTGTGVAGAYTSTTNGVTFTVGASSETSGHEAWRAVSVPTTLTNGVSIPPVGKFQLYEGESMVTNNQLWSPNGRWFLVLQSDYNWVLYDYWGILGGWAFQTISFPYTSSTLGRVTRITLTTNGFMLGYNAAGSLVFTSPNTATGYGPYRFAVENAGYFAIYDRYNTILWQSNAPSAGWETSGTYGGNTVESVGGYRIHTFTTVGSQKFAIPNYIPSLSVDYLIVAGGGGGGGGWQGGGGGAGGLIAASAVALSNGVYTVTVGAGGIGLTSTTAPTNGGNSSLVNTTGGTAISQTSIGGGGGGYEGNLLPLAAVGPGQTGGSGGGGAWSTLTAGAGTAGQGFAGGTAFNGANYTGAGGGGAGGVGQDSTSTTGGNGGNGVLSSITTASLYYAGGGGGSARASAVTTSGGAGGGGNGYGAGNGSSATYYGGGGGAGGSAGVGTEPCDGGNGFQGIVIIRYLISSVAVSNAWGFASVPQTLTFRMPTYYIPMSLLIQGVDYNNSTNSANAFTFSGSTDGINYRTLISNTTYLSNTDYGYNIYSITTNTAWNYFQLTPTGGSGLPGYVNQMILNGQISWSPTANAVTTNVTTANIFQIMGRAGVVGFGVTPVNGGPTLQFGSGNLYASNTLSGQNVIVTTIQTYKDDLTRRSPHLLSSTANYISIQNWIAASCNTTRRVGWSVASAPRFGTATVGVTGSALYASSLLGPDGRVYFTPASATNIGVFNPKTNEFSTIVPPSPSLTGTFKSVSYTHLRAHET